jgi:histo-blood group ABO system transferase
MPSSPPSVALLTIATARYFHTFVPNLLPSIAANFLPNHPTHTFILTDQAEDSLPSQNSGLRTQDSSLLPIEHHPWPYSTLLRFHHLLHHAPAYAHFDYLFYIDADMLVTDTILPDDILTPEGLSATEHPGYWPNKRGTFERNPDSTAFLPKSHTGPYYQGCFFGGPAPLFLLMANTLKTRIDEDLAHTPPLIAEWWDESHLNWFLAQYPPAKSLPPSYAYVDAYNLPVPRKIVHLPKNHEAMRAG